MKNDDVVDEKKLSQFKIITGSMCRVGEHHLCDEQSHENPFSHLYNKNFDIPNGRIIYLSRHGESEYNVEDRIGGDSNLTLRGQQYAQALGVYLNSSGMIDWFRNSI